jgi:lipooligosaccharide transport system permease protein
VLANFNPLYQCVELVRSAVFGWEGWVDLARLGALAAFGLVMWRVSIYAMTRKLVD